MSQQIDADTRGSDEDGCPGEVDCSRCGEGPFEWHHTGLRWVLLTEQCRIHQCDTNAQFQDLTKGTDA